MKQRKPRNPIARVLRTSRFRKRVVRNRMLYTRKGRSAAASQHG